MSVYDVIHAITGHNSHRQTWKDMCERYPDVVSKSNDMFTFAGQGQKATPVTSAQKIVRIIMLLNNHAAAALRTKWCDVLTSTSSGQVWPLLTARFYCTDPQRCDMLRQRKSYTVSI